MPSMHGLSIKTVNYLIRALPVGFLTLFSDACCTATSEQEPSEKQLQSTSTPGNESDNTSASSISKSRVFKDPDNHFTNFMNDPEISEIINEYFERVNLAQHEDYLRNKGDIHEVVAMTLYCYFRHTRCRLLNEDGSLKEEALQEAVNYLDEYGLVKISVSIFEFHHFPTNAWEFLIEHYVTDELSISTTVIGIAALNSPDLNNLAKLSLIDVGLTMMPCLSELTGFEYLFLNDNLIKHVSFQKYLDAEADKYRTMPNLKYLDLRGNHMSKIDATIKKVFPNLHTLILSKDKKEVEIDMSLPLSDIKKKLDEVGIKLTGLDRESEMDWMSQTN
ncbi:uncharacterized protein VICG_00289 [Vittaforma corneae ATCC 50505]|uniref:Uncharacterized protein n=1 Tax=Vittaforma corneae (strain ATCC 50505) TaxID=993615 RepID=L2GQD2_VITCO|nr:uncharacterized protein VICG_00289 [Vittaforma corneae ATCC 50505]ELA42537.1 hypothetical protein VICG_00289 [Vittaforma corneae ATCC 50505]